MESGRSMRGFGGRVVHSAKGLASGLVANGVGLEREWGDLALRCGKAPPTSPSVRQVQRNEAAVDNYHQPQSRGSASIRSEPTSSSAQHDFDTFADEHEVFDDLEFKERNVPEDIDFEKFMFQAPQRDQSWSSPRVQQDGHQCAESSTHTLPTEIQSMALDRLRQIEGHLATNATPSQEAQRRAELENEWLLWWDESPTACFDDSKDYFASDSQNVYTDAWKRHLENTSPVHIRKPYGGISGAPRLQAAPVRPMQQQTTPVDRRENLGCPNRSSHEDLAASRRSMPIAAQHRPCPHTGCGFCSTSSAAWFEHMRNCTV